VLDPLRWTHDSGRGPEERFPGWGVCRDIRISSGVSGADDSREHGVLAGGGSWACRAGRGQLAVCAWCHHLGVVEEPRSGVGPASGDGRVEIGAELEVGAKERGPTALERHHKAAEPVDRGHHAVGITTRLACTMLESRPPPHRSFPSRLG
jgi:hypothetical protein